MAIVVPVRGRRRRNGRCVKWNAGFERLASSAGCCVDDPDGSWSAGLRGLLEEREEMVGEDERREEVDCPLLNLFFSSFYPC